MRQLATATIILVLAAALFGCKQEAKDNSITIYSMVGEVVVISSNTEKPAAVGDVLITGDGIRTGSESIADIMYGSSGIIRIQPDSNIQIASLMDPATGNTQLDMAKGKMYVTLAKLKKGDFRVKTPTAVASVRGTSFRIAADEKASRLDVVTGAVRVNPVQNNTVVETVEKTVETNQTVELDEKTVKQAVEQKKEIAVKELKPEDAEQIREEIRTIRPEMIEKLSKEAREEIREKVLVKDDAAEREKREKEEKEKLEKEKKDKERALNALRAKRLLEEKLRTEKLIPQKQEKEKKPGPGTRGGDSQSAPPSLQTL